MVTSRNVVRLGAAMAITFGLAACANPFGGGQQQQQAPAATGTAGMQTGGGQWQDPKAPGIGARPGAATGADVDNDWDDHDLDT